MSFTVPAFVKDALERAGKTFCQTALTILGANAVNILHVDWQTVAGLGGGAALVSLLTSVASTQFGDKGTASLVSIDDTGRHAKPGQP